jgi:uncharacterized protein YcbX
MHLSGLYLYPIKSLGGIALEQSSLTERGLLWDRHWMLVDKQGKFLTQRSFPKMALLLTQWQDHHLEVRHRLKPEEKLSIDLRAGTGAYVDTAVWDDALQVEYVNAEADAFFSGQLGAEVRLVRIGAHTTRPADPRYVPDRQVEVSLADGYPFLIISQASLDDLNSRLAEPVPMDRFRPNVVVEGTEAFAEDTWKRIRIGSCIFRVVKPCARCVVTTIDQATAIAGKEPLRTLSSYRTVNHKVLFGQNMIVEEGSILRLGDKLEVLE